MAHKGQFKKGGGRIGDGRGRARKALSKHKRRSHGGGHRRGGRRRRAGGGGGIDWVTLGLTAAGLGLAVSSSSPIKAIAETVAKLPGQKTLGSVATLGLALGGIDKAGIWKHKYLRYAGYVGIALAAVKIGSDNTGFKWLGEGGDYAGDIDDVEDVEDVEGDDMGDVGGDE